MEFASNKQSRNGQQMDMTMLLDQTAKFIQKSELCLSPESRILDICSEFGEVFDSLAGRGDLREEVGDLLFSSLALCSELGLNDLTIAPQNGAGPADLAKGLGHLAKELLKSTDYGRNHQKMQTPMLLAAAKLFVSSVVAFASDKVVDLSIVLTLTIQKYEARLATTKSAASGR